MCTVERLGYFPRYMGFSAIGCGSGCEVVAEALAQRGAVYKTAEI